MKKLLLALFSVYYLLIPVYPVYAVEGPEDLPPPPPKERLINSVEKPTTAFDLAQERKEKLAQVGGIKKNGSATREAALKAKLQNFKDRKKATAAANLNENFNKLNQKKTTELLRHLEKLASWSARLDSKVKEASSTGKDTSEAVAAITAANTAIATAKTEVTAQQAKTYTVTVNDETTLKADLKATREQLATDLKATFELVKAAKDATANAIRITASTLGGVGNGN